MVGATCGLRLGTVRLHLPWFFPRAFQLGVRFDDGPSELREVTQPLTVLMKASLKRSRMQWNVDIHAGHY